MRCIIVLLAFFAVRLDAQATLKVTAELRETPAGKSVGVLRPGATVAASSVRGRYTRVVVDGYVHSALVARARQSGPVVDADGGATLRARPARGAVATGLLRDGARIQQTARRDDWVRVRREGWVLSSALSSTTSATSRGARESSNARPAPARVSAGDVAAPPARPTPVVTSPARALPANPRVADSPDSLITPARAVQLRAAPQGRPIVSIAPGAALRPVLRDRGWVRVRVEGWVLEKDLLPLDSALRTSLSAADLRADPQGTRGKIVRWNVQLLTLQTADDLRRELAVGETYFLARGPDEDNSILYLVVPPSLLDEAESMPSLASVVVTARVRNGRSEPVGVPILDLRSITRR